MQRKIMAVWMSAMLLLSGCSGRESSGTALLSEATEKISVIARKIVGDNRKTVPVDRLMLVNQWNPFPKGEAEGLTKITEAIPCRNIILKSSDMRANEEAVLELQKMADAMEKDGAGTLRVTSAYRSYAYQKDLFENKVQRVMASGTDYRDAQEEAAQEVARPGTSEHHTGLAFDFTGEDGTLEGFEYSRAYQWIKSFGAEYGFIIRYPEEKSALTGIIHEPCHLRYVGVEAAKMITEHQWCLEEYLNR